MLGQLFNLFGTISVNAQGAMNTLNGFEQRVRGTANRLGAGASNIGKVVSQNMMGFGTASLGVAGILGVAAKKAMDFEAQLSSVSALMSGDEKTPANLKKIKDYALEMGAKTKYSALEAAQGIEEMIKAGVSLEKVLAGGLEDALNLATAGELGLAEAAEIMSTALNSFSDEGLTSTKAANLLAGAANASATDVHDLKYALSSAAAVASLAGMNFEDTAGALAVMAQKGLKGSDAGTSLKSMMMNLIPKTKEQFELFERFNLFTIDSTKSMQFLAKQGIKPVSDSYEDVTMAIEQFAAKQTGAKVGSEKANKAFREIAMSQGLMHSAFYNEKGEMKSLADMADVLQGAFGDLTKEQQSYYLGQIFGSDGIRGAANIMKAGSEGVKKMQEEMSKVTAKEVAEEKLNNAKGAIEKLRGAIETLAITIGDKMVPYIRKAAEWINKLIDKFNALPQSQQDMIIKIGLIGAAVTFLLPVLGFLAGSINNIIGLFSMFSRVGGGLLRMLGLLGPRTAGSVSIFARLGTIFRSIWGVVGRLIGLLGRLGSIGRIAFTIIRVAMLAFSGPVGWIVAAIIGIIALIWKFRDSIGSALSSAGSWIAGFCGRIGTWFGNAWSGIVSGFHSAIGIIKSIMMPIGQWVNDWIVQPIKNAWGWAKNAYSSVKSFLGFGGSTPDPVTPFADGGHVTEPTMGLVGEAGPEVIIPVSPGKKDRGMGLWAKAGELLGVGNKAFKGWFGTGGIFSGPSVIGVGEAGSEAVIPLRSDVLSRIGAGVAATMKIGGGGEGVTIANATFEIVVEKLQTAADIERMRSTIQTVVADDLFSRAVRNF